MTTTARLAMPLIQPGQAQKELYHNEALLVADAAVQASVAAVGLDAPPANPAAGACWIVGSAPTGAWAGRAQALAAFTATGWRFVVPREGFAVWDAATRTVARYVEGTWDRGGVRGNRLVIGGRQVVGPQGPAVADPTGGATADPEARAAVAAILAVLRSHGLIAS
jgi:hypothetical protein